MQSQIKKSKYPGFKKSTITVDYRFLQTPLLYAIFNIVTCSVRYLDYMDYLIAIMFEPEATDLVIVTHESEKVNGSDINTERAEDEGTDESILGKVFDKPDDAYNFYNDYAFLHGFGIRKDDTIKNTTTNEAYRKMYVCNKEGFKRLEKNASIGNEKKTA
ncbi:hypothetical protein LXL04_011802 [Taraxacum kok-saghyz]